MSGVLRKTILVATVGFLATVSLAICNDALATTATGAAQPVGASATSVGSRVPIRDVKIINYYPSAAGWAEMWTDYSHTTTESDFAAIRSLGANTVRIIVQPDAVGYPVVQPSRGAELDDMINVARADGLSIQLTLFDMWHRYFDVAGSETWVKSLLAGEAGDPIIDLVELQNEMPLTPGALAWARDMLPFLRTVLPAVPRTVSEPGSGGNGAIRALLSNVPRDDLDAIDVHYYGSPALADSELKQVIAESGGRPVFIGETGVSSFHTAGGEEAQARFYEIMGQTTQDLGLPPPSPWMLNDVTRAEGERLNSDQEYFGLRRADGTWKPAATVVRDVFQGQPPHNWDPDMRNEATGNGTSLGAWTEFDPSAGVPWVAENPTHNGSESICYDHTGGDSAKLPAVEQAFPVLSDHRTFSATAWIERQGGTGLEEISIAEFNADDMYIGEVDSPVATGSGRWQQLSVSAQEPPGVASVQIHLKAGYERGTACWSDVAINA